MKRHLWNWRNIADHVSDRGLISEIYKGLLHSIAKKPTNLIKKLTKETDISPKKNGQWCMKKYSMPLTIRVIQIKTTMKYCLTPVRGPLDKK